MKKIRIVPLSFLIFLFVSVFPPLLRGQEYFFDHYGVKQGLEHSKIYKIIQGRSGYIWIGNPAGLSKFDGQNFINYTTRDGLAPYGVNALFQDSSGTLWIGHLEGNLTRYRHGHFEVITLDSVRGDITEILTDPQNRLWISTTGSGVYRIDDPFADRVKISAHLTASNGPGNIVFSMTYTRSLGMIFVTRYGVKFFNKNIGKYEFVNEQFFNWPQYFQIIKVKEDPLGGIWVGTYNGGIYHYPDFNSMPVIIDKRDGIGNNFISDIIIASDTSAWIATFGGGISHITTNNKITTYHTGNGLPDNKIKSLCQDAEGNILIGTYSKGLAIFKGKAFVNYRKFEDNKPVQVQAVAKEAGVYFFGTPNGLIKAIPHPGGSGFDLEKIVADGINLMSNDIRFLKTGPHGKLWIGTWGGGVVSYDLRGGKINYPYRPNVYISRATNNSNNVTALEFDKNGDLWIGTYAGLIYYQIDSNRVAMIGQTSGLWNNDISALYCDNHNVLWIGNRSKGLSVLKGTRFSHIKLPLQFTPVTIYGNEEELWIGTEGMGLLKIKNGKIIQHLTTDNGLSSNMITTITVDHSGKLLLGTNTGLNVLDTATGHISVYGAKDGFVGIEVKPNAVLTETPQRVWLGTAEGVTVLNPLLLKENKKPPFLEITSMMVNLEPQEMKENMELSYSENSVIFYYKGISISDESKVVYKVRMLGIDKGWQPVTKQNFANYPSLPAGDYTFQVMARNNSGVWSARPAEFHFTILPPFWQTWWFYTIIAVLFTAGLILFVKIRERKLKHEKAILEKKVHERTIEIREKNRLLARKNKDITDSITYAKRIQRAMMPSTRDIDRHVKSSFIYYRPKDIVSGDFHWNTWHNDRLVVVAADCTGHGVPGAFMSMISISSLNKIVKEKGVTDPGEILNQMRKDIIYDLKQSGDVQAKDGLDIALLSIDPQTNTIYFAGAYNSMYLVKSRPFDPKEIHYNFNYTIYQNQLIEVKADRMPIGVSERLDKRFTTKAIKVESGDSVFITTDGYIDQFGGDKGKKFMSKRFKNLLLSLPWAMPDRSLALLEDQFITWRGEYEQIDDVLVIGICF